MRAQNTESVKQRFDSLAQKADYYFYLNRAKGHNYLQEIKKIALSSQSNSYFKGQYIFREVEWFFEQGSYDTTLMTYIQEELNNPETQKHSSYQAQLQYSLSLNKLTQGNYAEAFNQALHALEYFRQEKDSLFIAKSLLVLGRVYSYIESFEMAETYFKETLDYTAPSTKEYYQTKSNLCYIYVLLGNPQKAIHSLLELIQDLEQKNGQFIELLILSYLNIGSIYDMQKEYEQAYLYYVKAKQSSPLIDNNLFLISLYQNMGTHYTNIQNLTKAHENFLFANNLAQKTQNPNLIANILPSLVQTYEQLHRIDSAYFYLKKYNEIKIRNLQNSNLIEAYQAYISSFLDASKKEIIIKEQEIQLNNRRFIFTIVSATAIILLITALLVIFNQQRRHSRQTALLKEAENRELEERLQADQQIHQLQQERIDAQIRELTSSSLALSNKNNILQQIAEAVERLPENPAAIEEIRQVIKNNLSTDKAWHNFLVHFDKVHPDFFNKIKYYSEDFSENDLRLCAYLRIGMSTKQIAQMLNVSPESIRMHRYRIKKKFSLSEEKKLDDFIRNI